MNSKFHSWTSVPENSPFRPKTEHLGGDLSQYYLQQKGLSQPKGWGCKILCKQAMKYLAAAKIKELGMRL